MPKTKYLYARYCLRCRKHHVFKNRDAKPYEICSKGKLKRSVNT